MNTHNIRWNGSKTHRIVTFTKTFEKELIKAHPQAIRVFISSFLEHLKNITGHKHTMDYKQECRIEKHLIQDQTGKLTPDQRLADNWMQNGVRLLDVSLPEVLHCLDFIYGSILPITRVLPVWTND